MTETLTKQKQHDRYNKKKMVWKINQHWRWNKIKKKKRTTTPYKRQENSIYIEEKNIKYETRQNKRKMNRQKDCTTKKKM